MFKIGLEKSRFLQITTFLYGGRWEKKEKKKKKKEKKKKKRAASALGPSGRGQPSLFFSCAAGRLPAP